MFETEFHFEDDKLVRDTPMPGVPGTYKSDIIMTKDVFIKCYQEWIANKENKDNTITFERYMFIGRPGLWKEVKNPILQKMDRDTTPIVEKCMFGSKLGYIVNVPEESLGGDGCYRAKRMLDDYFIENEIDWREKESEENK